MPTLRALSKAASQRANFHVKPLGLCQVKYAVVAIDSYTKWVEAEPLANITGQNVVDFVWKKIICHFGIPNNLVYNHGT